MSDLWNYFGMHLGLGKPRLGGAGGLLNTIIVRVYGFLVLFYQLIQ